MAKTNFTPVDDSVDDKMEATMSDRWIDPLAAAEAVETGEKDVEVEIVDDTPPKDRNRKPAPPPGEVTEDELNQYSDKVKKRIQHLNKSYHDVRREKDQAQREKEELERLAGVLLAENNSLKGTVGKNQTTLLAQAKQGAQLELDAAKKQYREAYEAGDTDKVIAAQEAMTKAQLKVDKVANFRPAPLQEGPADVKTALNTQQPPSAPQRVKDERAEAWAKDNSWFGSDDEMTAYALGLHSKLLKQGVDPTSDDYYETLNSRMRQVFPDQFDEEPEDTEQPDPVPAPRPKVTVATASRGVAPQKYKLTKTQVQIAKKLGVPLDEYAKAAAALSRTN